MLILKDGLAQGSFGSLFHRFTPGFKIPRAPTS